MASARGCFRTDFAGKTRQKTTSHKRRAEMKNHFGLGVLAYLVPTFALGFVWHLILFKQYYEDLAIYRKDISRAEDVLSCQVRLGRPELASVNTSPNQAVRTVDCMPINHRPKDG
jgi:hypothetical protein